MMTHLHSVIKAVGGLFTVLSEGQSIVLQVSLKLLCKLFVNQRCNFRYSVCVVNDQIEYFIESCPWCCAVETGEVARSSPTDYRDLKAHGCVSGVLCECVLMLARVCVSAFYVNESSYECVWRAMWFRITL